MSKYPCLNRRFTVGIIALALGPAAVRAVPPNDNCADAVLLPPAGGTVSGTLVGATNDGSASCGNSTAAPDVWYFFSSSLSATLYLSTCISPTPIALSVHTGCPGTIVNEIVCHQEGSCPVLCGALFGTCLSTTIHAGDTYWIRVAGQNGATGNFNLHITAVAPSGDFNHDGIADGRDIAGFVAAAVAASTDPTDLAAGDFNGNGQIDSGDVSGLAATLLAV